MDGPETSKRSIRLVLNTAEVATRRHGNQQLAIVLFVNRKAIRAWQKLLHRRLRVIALAPRTIGKEIFGHIFNHSVENDQIAFPSDQRRISLELSEHVLARVIRIEHDENRLSIPGHLIDSIDNLSLDGRAFHQINSSRQLVIFNFPPVVFSYVYIYAHNPPVAAY